MGHNAEYVFALWDGAKSLVFPYYSEHWLGYALCASEQNH
jgi:hypothetical protein